MGTEDYVATFYTGRKECRWRMALTLALTFMLLTAFALPQAMALGTAAGTVIKNKATATYKDANGNDMPGVESNEVSTTVSQVATVDVSPASSGQSGTSGGYTAYAVTVCNKGNDSDTIDLSQLTTPPGGQTWTATIVNDEDQDDIYDPLVDVNVVSDTGALAADACKKIFVVVQIDDDATNGQTASTVLTATSQFDNGKTDTGTYTTTASAAAISAVKSVEHIDTNSDGNIDPGEELVFKIALSNTGATTAYDLIIEDVIDSDTLYSAGSMKAGGAADTYASADELTDVDDSPDGDDTPAGVTGEYVSGPPEKAVFEKTSLAAGARATFFLKVAVKAGTLQGTAITNSATVKHDLVEGDGGTQYTTTSNVTTDTVGYYTSILLDPDRSGSYDPGDQVVYDFTITNNGNAADTVDLSGFTAGWTWVIWEDDGDGTFEEGEDSELTPTGGVVTTTAISPNGGTLKIFAVTTVPAGTADTTVDTTTITGTSNNDGEVTDTETLTITVTGPSLSINKEVSPAGAQPPGAVLTYTVTVTNDGTGQATAVIINDIVPAFTTYVGSSIQTGATVGTLAVRTDAADNDGAKFEGGAVVVPDGAAVLNLDAEGTWVVRFQVTID